MASFTRSFFSTIIISTLLLSTQIHARDSYFFHKFQRDNAQDKNLSFEPVEANQKTSSAQVLPKNDQEQQDQDPRFVPESENGYGLYGHETTYNNDNNINDNGEFNKKYEENVNYEPYNTPRLSQNEESYNNDKYSKGSENNNNNNNNNDNDKSYYNSNAYGTERSYNGNNNNVERQGMSDTRFMDNGKYYFDVNDDKNHGDLYKKHYRHNPSYAVSNYDRFGPNNNGGSFYDNEQNSFQDPYNSKWEKNTMNEQEQEEEFGEEQQDQFVP